jgi:two-component system response regulator CpxR
MIMDKILLIDDDVELAELLKEYLLQEGLEVTLAHSGEDGLNKINNESFDLLVLDVMLPGLSGLELLPMIRSNHNIPVLMLTARGDEIDRIIGLELGADDYLAKPSSPRELFARIKAILRRSRMMPSQQPNEKLSMGDLSIETSSRQVFVKQKVCELTGTEFNLLLELMRNHGNVQSREELSLKILDRRLTAFDRSLDMHVSNLRKKLSLGEGNLPAIKTIRGSGYIFTEPSIGGAGS